MDGHIPKAILKSSIATLGKTKLHQLCQDLENMSKGSTTTGAPILVSQLEVDYEPIEATLQAQQRQ